MPNPQKYETYIIGGYDDGTYVDMIEEDDGRYYKAEEVDPLLKELEDLRAFKASLYTQVVNLFNTTK